MSDYYEHYDDDDNLYLELVCVACGVGGCGCYLETENDLDN